MVSLLAKLSEQQVLLAKQKSALSGTPEASKQVKDSSSNSSTLLTPASESFSSPTDDGHQRAHVELAEMARLKRDLDDAKEQIARQKQELDQSRVVKHTFDQALGPPSDAALSPPFGPAGAFTTSHRPMSTLQGPWRTEDARSDGSDVIVPINNAPNVWSGSSRLGFNLGPNSAWGQQNSRTWGQRGMDNTMPPPMMSQQPPMQQRNYSVPISPVSGGSRRGMNDFDQFSQGRGYGQNNRNTSVFQPGSGWNGYSTAPGPIDGMNLGGMNPGSAYPSLGFPSAYQPQPIGTPLSPTAAEFRAGQASGNPWNNATSVSQIQIDSQRAMTSTNSFTAFRFTWTDLRITHGASQLPSSS